MTTPESFAGPQPPPAGAAALNDEIDKARLGSSARSVRLAPLAPVRWVLSTVVALAITIVVGLSVPSLMRSVFQAVLSPADRLHPPVWVELTLLAGYWLFVATMLAPFLVFTAWSFLDRRGLRRGPVERWPKVSILIPAFNEQESILDAIGGALGQDYPDFEVIVIDDGSTDRTGELSASTAARVVRHEGNRGKAAALNSGLAVAQGEVIVMNDADGHLDPQAIRHLVAALDDQSIGAVAGQVRLLHPDGIVRGFQVLEYAYGQAVVKQAQYASAGTVLIAPGPVGAYRANLLQELGGVPDETLTEDFDLSLQVIAHGWRIAYEPRAIAYTNAPQTDAELRRQRIRWARGALQVFVKHHRLLGAKHLGLTGVFWLPYSLFTWYTTAPLAILGIVLLPILSWGSGSPTRFLACLSLYGVPVLVVEIARLSVGLLSFGERDLRLFTYAPLFLAYQKFRLDWFPLEALDREWRHLPKTWND